MQLATGARYAHRRVAALASARRSVRIAGSDASQLIATQGRRSNRCAASVSQNRAATTAHATFPFCSIILERKRCRGPGQGRHASNHVKRWREAVTAFDHSVGAARCNNTLPWRGSRSATTRSSRKVVETAFWGLPKQRWLTKDSKTTNKPSMGERKRVGSSEAPTPVAADAQPRGPDPKRDLARMISRPSSQLRFLLVESAVVVTFGVFTIGVMQMSLTPVLNAAHQLLSLSPVDEIFFVTETVSGGLLVVLLAVARTRNARGMSMFPPHLGIRSGPGVASMVAGAFGGFRSWRWSFWRAALVAFALAMIMSLLQSSSNVPQEESDTLISAAFSQKNYPMFSICVYGPFIEELLFRGLLFGRLLMGAGVVPAYTISSLAFAAAHSEEDANKVALAGAAGFVLAFTYHVTGRFWVPVVLHTVNNIISYWTTRMFSPLPPISDICLQVQEGATSAGSKPGDGAGAGADTEALSAEMLQGRSAEENSRRVKRIARLMFMYGVTSLFDHLEAMVNVTLHTQGIAVGDPELFQKDGSLTPKFWNAIMQTFVEHDTDRKGELSVVDFTPIILQSIAVHKFAKCGARLFLNGEYFGLPKYPRVGIIYECSAFIEDWGTAIYESEFPDKCGLDEFRVHMVNTAWSSPNDAKRMVGLAKALPPPLDAKTRASFTKEIKLLTQVKDPDLPLLQLVRARDDKEGGKRTRNT